MAPPVTVRRNITLLDTNQNIILTKMNDIINLVIESNHLSQIVDVSPGGGIQLDTEEYENYFHFIIQGSPPGDFTLVVPDGEKLFSVQNDTSYTCYIESLDSTGGSILAVPPNKMMIVYNKGIDIVRVGVSDFELSFYVPGLPGNGETVVFYVATTGFILPQNLTNSQGKSIIAATSQADFDILLNDVSIGTIRFAAAATTASFIFSTETDVNPGDTIKITAPSPQDGALSEIAITLKATGD